MKNIFKKLGFTLATLALVILPIIANGEVNNSWWQKIGTDLYTNGGGSPGTNIIHVGGCVGCGGGGTGTVTSVGMSVPTPFSVSGSPITTSGTLGLTFSDPNANSVLGWDNTDNAGSFWNLGSGLSYDHGTHTLAASGGVIGTGTVSHLPFINTVDGSNNILTLADSPMTYDGDSFLTDMTANTTGSFAMASTNGSFSFGTALGQINFGSNDGVQYSATSSLLNSQIFLAVNDSVNNLTSQIGVYSQDVIASSGNIITGHPLISVADISLNRTVRTSPVTNTQLAILSTASQTGHAGEFLTTNGSGTLSYAPAGAGSITGTGTVTHIPLIATVSGSDILTLADSSIIENGVTLGATKTDDTSSITWGVQNTAMDATANVTVSSDLNAPNVGLFASNTSGEIANLNVGNDALTFLATYGGSLTPLLSINDTPGVFTMGDILHVVNGLYFSANDGAQTIGLYGSYGGAPDLALVLVDYVAATIQLGDTQNQVNGTLLTVDETNQLLTFVSAGNSSFKLDNANHLYQMGDYLSSINGTYLNVDDASKIISLRGDYGMNDNQFIQANFGSGVLLLGDIGNGVNGGVLELNDASERMTYQINSQQYLSLNINNNEYQIGDISSGGNGLYYYINNGTSAIAEMRGKLASTADKALFRTDFALNKAGIGDLGDINHVGANAFFEVDNDNGLFNFNQYSFDATGPADPHSALVSNPTGSTFATWQAIPYFPGRSQSVDNTAAIGTTTAATIPATGANNWCRISGNMTVQTAGILGTITLTANWTDRNGARSLNMGSVTVNTAGSYLSNSIFVECVASSTVTYSTTFVGVTLGALKYDVAVAVEQMI